MKKKIVIIILMILIIIASIGTGGYYIYIKYKQQDPFELEWVTIYYNYCFPGESGNFFSQECSVNVIMARQNETILNTVEFYDEGYLSYSFNLKEYKLAS